ncbi:hypothetical protein [Nocardioides marmoraquaticus]
MNAQRPTTPPDGHEPDDHAELEQLQAQWPTERPSKRRQRRAQRRKRERGPVTVRAVRRDKPDPERMSHALLAARRGLAEAQAEADARRELASDDQPSQDSDEESRS